MNLTPRRLFNAGLLLLIIAGCEPKETEEAAPPPLVPPPTPPAATVQFTQEQFSELRWLEGDWMGKMPDGTAFYESYRVINDTTVQMYALSDSTLVAKTDSSRIYLSGGRIYNEGRDGSRSVVERMDSTGVYFIPDRGGYRYVWMPIAPNEWSAKLENGTVYPMTRVRR